MRNGRQCSGAGVEQPGALPELQRRADFGEVRGDVTHDDWPLQRRREAAAGDSADFIAFAVEHERALADRLPAVDLETDALLDRSIVEFGKDAHGTGEAPLGAATLVDGESEPSHHRRGPEVEIMAV